MRTLLFSVFFLILKTTIANAATFSALCDRQIENLFCFQNEFSLKSTCENPDPQLLWVQDEVEEIFVNSPAFLKGLICQLARVRIVKIKPAQSEMFAAFHVSGHLVFFEENLNYYKSKSELSVPGSFLFFHKEHKNHEIEQIYDLTIDADTEFSARKLLFAYSFLHELGHFLDQFYFTFGAKHCLPSKSDKTDAIEALGFSAPSDVDAYCDLEPKLPVTPKTIKQLAQIGIPNTYAACTKKEEFAEIFALYTLNRFFNVNFKIKIGEQSFFNQSEFLSGSPASEMVDFLDTLFGLDNSTPQNHNQIILDHMMCTGPFSTP
jgi:hypothetical protein